MKPSLVLITNRSLVLKILQNFCQQAKEQQVRRCQYEKPCLTHGWLVASKVPKNTCAQIGYLCQFYGLCIVMGQSNGLNDKRVIGGTVSEKTGKGGQFCNIK